MMRNIYLHVIRVVVWLGPEANESDSSMSTIKYLGSWIQLDVNGYMAVIPADGAVDLDSTTLDMA